MADVSDAELAEMFVTAACLSLDLVWRNNYSVALRTEDVLQTIIVQPTPSDFDRLVNLIRIARQYQLLA